MSAEKDVNSKVAKKILYVAYQFPPNGGGGVQRALRHANALANAGHSLDVITVEKSNVNETSLINKIHPKIKIIKVRDALVEFESIIKSKIISKIISFLSFPDRNVFWAINVYLRFRNFNYDVVMTTSHPYSSHIIGVLFKNKNPSISLIVDYRDAWNLNPSLKYTKKYPLLHLLSGPLERYINRKSDKIITVSTKLTKYILTEKKIDVIYNAFDEDDFENNYTKKESEKFTIFYMGSIYAERNFNNFILALNNFLKKISDVQKKLVKIKIVGINNVEKIKNQFKKEITYYDDISVEILNYVPHDKIVQHGLLANLLLLFIQNTFGSDAIVTGKLLEYIKFNAPILAIVPKNGEAADIISRTQTGNSFGDDEIHEISSYISEIFNEWLIDNRQSYFFSGVDREQVNIYSKKTQNEKLIKLISHE